MRSSWYFAISIAITLFVLTACGGSGSNSSSLTGSAGATQPCGANLATCRLNAVAYGAGVFVAVGVGGAGSASGGPGPWIETSADGVSWSPVDSSLRGTTAELQSIAYGSPGFVATDGEDVVFSPNGKVWQKSGIKSELIQGVEYDGTDFVLYEGDKTPFMKSADGLTWTAYGSISVTAGNAGIPYSIIHVGSQYVAAWATTVSGTSTNDLTATSSDGLSWTPGTSDPTLSASLNALVYTGTKFVGAGVTGTTSGSTITSDGLVVSGTDPSALSIGAPVTSATGNSFLTGIVWNGSVLVALGTGSVFTSSDATTWTETDLSTYLKSNATCTTGPSACVQTSAIAAAPHGAVVVLAINEGIVSMDGVHWAVSRP